MTDPLDFLYPPIDAHAEGVLEVGDGHSIWWEESGSPTGVPAILLHGGPGAPPTPRHRQYFDPDHYRLIVMHQRGCGKSRPLAETRGNTTDALIADIEALRVHRGIDSWLISGGSWGSTLALAYGERHPERCRGFSLIGVALARPFENDWWWHGTGKLFPEAYDGLLGHLAPEHRGDPRAAYHRLVMDPDPAIHLPAAKALCLFSAATVAIAPDPARLAVYDDPDIVLPLARLFLHYGANGWFLQPGELLANLDRIGHLPCAIVSGRYDVTTPPEAAWTLHKLWPRSSLTIVPHGAHGLSDPDVSRAFLASHESLKARIAPDGAA